MSVQERHRLCETMINAFLTIQTNLGMAIELIICLLLFLGELIFLARNFLLGAQLGLVCWALTFIAFYLGGWNWTFPLILMFMHVAMLALSFLAVKMSKTVYQ